MALSLAPDTEVTGVVAGHRGEPFSLECRFPMLERTSQLPAEPHAETHSARSTWHGFDLVDDYSWLRAANWREVMRDPAALDPAIRAYLDSENAFADRALDGTQALQEALFAEMKGRIKEDDSTVP